MENTEEIIYNKAGGYISEITFNNGQNVSIAKNDIVVFVGPNNVGKSQALKDIFQISNYKISNIVVNDVKFKKSDIEIQTILEKVAFKQQQKGYIQYTYLNQDYVYNEHTMQQFKSSTSLGNLRDFFMVYLDTSKRLSICNPATSIRLDQAKTHPIHYAAYLPERRKWLTESFYKAFGQDLIPNTNFGSTIPLSIGKSVKFEMEFEDEQTRQEEYRKILAKYPQVQNQGDGMKSFTGILLYLMLDFYCTYLIDEPESFLHPPQARIMGQIIGETLRDDQQAFISTHSEDLIKGLIAVCPERIKIIRITREGNTNSFSILNNEKFQEVWNDPLLRYSNIMSGIFHKSVVVCESDSDCKIYQIIDEFNAQEKAQHSETLFIHCGGKHRMANVVKALKSLNVNVKVVPDIDVLDESNTIKGIYEAIGGNWHDIREDYGKFRSPFNGVSSSVKRSTFKNFINAFLDASTEVDLSKDEIKRIKDEIKPSTKWDILKISGEGGIPAGETKVAYNSMNAKLKDKGIFVVPVGELERFITEVNLHGPKWVDSVLEQFPDLNNPVYDKVKTFINDVTR